jgi:hypothetical protein
MDFRGWVTVRNAVSLRSLCGHRWRPDQSSCTCITPLALNMINIKLAAVFMFQLHTNETSHAYVREVISFCNQHRNDNNQLHVATI